MRPILIRPLKGGWQSYESDGVEPFWVGSGAKEDALSYALQRFGGCTSEVHVYDDKGEKVVKVLSVNGGGVNRPDDFRLFAKTNLQYLSFWQQLRGPFSPPAMRNWFQSLARLLPQSQTTFLTSSDLIS